MLRLLLFFLTAGEVVSASQHWLRVATPHFEMYTTDSAKQATRALQTFEQVRYFFLQKDKNKQSSDDQVRVIAFSSEKEYKPYRLNAGAFAYYLRSRERDYIVMQDIEADHHRAAVHEYTHLIVEHMKLELPIWLNEGLADLYSSLEPRGRQAMVGRALESHIAVLSQARWMDWNTLFAVDHASPFYNERDKMSIFYAQSWILTHMLALSPTYSSRFGPFMTSVSEGASAAQAFQKVYGKGLPGLAKDVSAYMKQTSFRAALFDVSLSPSDLDPQVEELSGFQTDLALAELLASRKETQEEARRRLLALSQQDGRNVEVEEALGYLAWQGNDQAEARKHFALAAERGSKNVHMLYDAAILEQSGDGAPGSAVSLLHKVIALQPDNSDARILLAEVEARQSHYALALGATGSIKSVKPDQAYRLFAISAYIRANMHDLDGARQSGEKALEYARTPAEKQHLAQLLHSIDDARRPAVVTTGPVNESQPASEPATSKEMSAPSNRPIATRLPRDQGLPEASGKTKSFECAKEGYRLHILVGGTREMVFEMGNPEDILVHNIKNLEWHCGPLPPGEVTVIYRPLDSPKLSGKVAELIFKPQAH